ncbi:hypothetical protein [Sphingobacterium kyonggiense]
MPYKQDEEIDLTSFNCGKYIISSHHRRKNNPHKSVWTISFDDEVDCFVLSLTSKWNLECEAWGIKLNDNGLETIGINADSEELKLAKFVDGAKTNTWHGYPADYVKKSQDRPSTEILHNWVKEGYIAKHKMVKIRQGQSCNL